MFVRYRVGLCETQPLTVAGLRHLLNGCDDLELAVEFRSLPRFRDLNADVLLVDKAFGVQPILEWLAEVASEPVTWSAVVWGAPLSEAEALRFVRAGARGVLQKTACVDSVLDCIRTVARGECWMPDPVSEAVVQPRYPSRSGLTPREHQVLELVELGCRNREIAQALGIRPGTVKIHLKHIFEKTGIHGRYGLALSGFREKALVPEPTSEVEPEQPVAVAT
jgi:DNA-binding NarL/FixJ family response regulator